MQILGFAELCDTKKMSFALASEKVGSEQTAVKSLRLQRLRQCERDFFRGGAADERNRRHFCKKCRRKRESCGDVAG